MESLSQGKWLQLSLEERVKVVNRELERKTLKQISSELEMNKVRIKEMLKPYQYNINTRRYELEKVLVTEAKEIKNDEMIMLLSDIKNLLQNNNEYQKKLNETVTKLATEQVVEEKKLKVNPNDELMIRSFKIYGSVNERLKLATKNSELNQQQLFNSLLHQALQSIGF